MTSFYNSRPTTTKNSRIQQLICNKQNPSEPDFPFSTIDLQQRDFPITRSLSLTADLPHKTNSPVRSIYIQQSMCNKEFFFFDHNVLSSTVDPQQRQPPGTRSLSTTVNLQQKKGNPSKRDLCLQHSACNKQNPSDHDVLFSRSATKTVHPNQDAPS